MFKQYKGLRKELYVLFFGRIVTNLGSMIWPMLTLILNRKLNMTAEQVGNWFLAFSIIGLPFTLLAGKLTDKFNKRNLIIFCDIISFIGFIICGIIPLSTTTIIVFEIASLFQGIEGSAYDALVADFSTPKDRNRAYSLMYLAVNIGLILAPTIGGILFNNYLYLAFLIDGFAIITSTILIFFLVKNTQRETSIDDVNEYEKDSDESTIKFILSNRVMLINIVVCLLCNAVYNQWTVLLPIDLGITYGDNGSLMLGAINSINCITVVLATALITTLSAKMLDINKFIVGELLQVLGLFICIILIKTPITVFLGIVIFSIGEIVISITSRPYDTKRIPANHRGRYTSIVNVSCNLFTAISTKYLGSIYDKKGSISAWVIVYIMGLVDVLVIMIQKRLDKKDYKNLYD